MTEFLLNLAWVLLAVPACWLWQRRARAQNDRRATSLQCLLALGCVLVLLFPVISASDDLHAMRAEMEDSSISKRTVRQAASDKASALVNRLHGPAAVVAGAAGPVADKIARLEPSVVSVSPLSRLFAFHAGRAPPFSRLG